MAKIVTKAPGLRFKKVHPTKSAGKKFRGDEGEFVRCKQCGFIVKVERHPKGSGWGNENPVVQTSNDSDEYNVYDPTVTAGCPFCGSSEYR